MPEPDPLLALFADYNPAIWPEQVLAYLGAAAVVALVLARPSRLADRVANAYLVVLWLFIGIAFHWLYVRALDPVQSLVYAAAFTGQAALFLALGVVGRGLSFRPRRDLPSVVGWAAIGYALLVYPLIGIALGHPYPEAPLFGAAPCPTTIFTFGMLLLAVPPVPRAILVVPMAWAIVATPAAVGRGVLEDIALLGIGIVTLVLLATRRGAAVEAERATGRVGSPAMAWRPADTRPDRIKP